MTPEPDRRVLVVTDSDSYVKYGAALAGQLPQGWEARLIVVRSGVLPSPRQIEAALEGTRFERTHPDLLDLTGVERLLRSWRPDAVLLTARGYTVQAVVALIENVPQRPVLVAGLAGIAYPVLPLGLGYRRAMDVFIVHSHRELRAFPIKSASLGLVHDFELATLPYLDRAKVPATPAGDATPFRDRIVFAAQAQVPADTAQRRSLVAILARTARAHPELTVVVKVRAADGESQTHYERHSLPALMEQEVDLPANLVVEAGSMRSQLERAVGFVTVSSTAILEAIGAGVPCIALDDFGVSAAQINVVLEGSGLLVSADALVAGDFRRPADDWLDDNYFHADSDNTWLRRVEELLDLRELSGLPPYRSQPWSVSRALRQVLDRHVTFRAHRSPAYTNVERFFVVTVSGLNQARRGLIRRLR